MISHGLAKYFDVPINFTNNFLAVLISFAIAYALATSFEVDPFPAGLISMVSFFIITPYTLGAMGPLGQAFSISNQWLGAQGIFTGMIVAFVSTRLFVAITRKGIIIKVPDSVPEFIAKSFSSLIPGILILTMFSVIAAVLSNTSYGSIHALIYQFLQTPLTSLGSGIGSVLIVATIASLLWFLGLHGHAIVLGVVSPIWTAMDVQQLAAFSSGQPLPNITGMAFFWTYIAGNLLPLAFMFAFRSKSARYKTLGKVAIVPAIFTIGEPLAYGTPLVMNFVFAIPYIFMDAIILGIAYVLTVNGILPPVGGVYTPSGTPVILSGFIQGSWKIALFQAVALVIRFGAWFFFFKLADKMAVAEEEENSKVETVDL
ncbi:PTS sugar transporter subunit IIC [Clostridium estertheticum]|uniref:PTS sugar transporter subunit IIC n=1 Tax=Clostridium estertheticum TaxID=238834 RepID=UPI00299F0154|nr:PTS transporter subunit EIIC [Clostridium estertheticum]